ncbi:nuclear pore complex protein Nup153 isoform X1 [Anastrepha obliqua]|uniref:nuclear pore complex protein Nup153 isoform X1 n=1 Tax=Anastrepha obliqua TaxID=95512 RepID=UPI0024097203|nr:nuclear pore complex protein Nup153 isoform X1 [Anastrepha obliqua]XP_054730890.1 nuclear pore complex protein Nup153 isoform X1 [Anastrepha obliqua]
MSAEYEASRNAARRSDIVQKTMKTDSSNDDDDTLEDLAGSANNSIIGKVKSRVSSIIPTSFSKWFSPSTRNNDSLNGSFSVGTARRRRRLEIEDDEEYVDDGDTNEDGVLSRSEYKENLVSRSDNANKDSDEDDSDNNSDDDSPNEPVVSTQRAHRTTKSSSSVNQPPSKRSRISFDATSTHHQPLIASTPAVGVCRRNINSHSYPLVEETLSKPSTSPSLSYFIETNVYNQKKMEQPATYAFLPAPDTDVNSQEKFANRLNTNEQQLESVTAISSRRTLHLPSTSQAAKERSVSMSFPSFKRQTLSGIRNTNNQNAVSPTINTSTTIIEEAFGKEEGDEFRRQDKQAEVQSDAKSRRKVNGSTLPFVGSKKQKLNGTDEPEVINVDADSASDSSDGCMDLPNNLTQRKTGLFNMSHLNCHNGNKSRTSSFGNGINFYSHLEGRKSLFSGGANIAESANALNNSTLSLTSLNRRQFNASIYGSTSALSDSRLLNTFSPFYKGKTTYGGAAAYKKFSAGSGASKICNLAPTIIRPTSSLSTLSSSNNSITANIGGTNAPGGVGSNGTENTSAISSTAKRILDLINGFATPLSEAKKMANTSVKANPQLLPQAKSRLNETDLQASRMIRLSQVRTPYARPAVTLQPTIRNSTLPPPVRELQVPSMTQLLQMKKMQSTTERSRQITMQNSGSTTRPIIGGSEYVLPIINENNVIDKEDSQTRQQQQPHTNKIKSKGRTSARITASKNVNNLEIDESPPPVNLPNIAFPLMQSVPKFDIALPKPPIVAPAGTIKPDFPKLDILPNSKSAVVELQTIGSSNNKNVFANKTASNLITDSKKIAITERSKDTEDFNSNGSDKKSVSANFSFKFSAPLTFEYVEDNASPGQNISAPSKNYKFSPPTSVCFGAVGTSESSTNRKVQSDGTVTPQLKSGSVLDALKKPFALPATPKENATNSESTEIKSGFGDKFKKSTSNKWECETCLIYNASDADKCVACETPRIKSSSIPPTEKSPSTTLLATTSSQFGAQFKKSSDEWECDSCLIRNKQQADRCVACETSRKGAATPSVLGARTWQSNSFGDSFKKKANTWDCPTCLINNKSDCTECVACQTKNPGSDSSSTCPKANTKNTHTFGFDNVAYPCSAQSNASSDIGFKSLAAAQMSAKWECDACMTRNDAARNKCNCCEQAKPGTTTPDVPANGPKFMFGSAASSKFTFGFGTNANGTSATDSGVGTTSVIAPNQKTDTENITGFVFGSTTKATTLPSGGSGFSFGIKPTSVSPKNEVTSKGSESKDVADSVNSSNPAVSEATPSASKLSTSTTSVGKNVVTTNTTVNFKFGVPPSCDTATTTTTAAPAVKFSLTKSDFAAKDVPAKSSEPNASFGESTTGGFKFGNSITNANLQPSASSFTFGVPAKSVSPETSTTTTTTNTFSFGASASAQPGQSLATSTATSTATVKPMFSFGGTTTSTTAATASTLASSSTTSSSTSASAFTNTAGGFSFGSSITGSATASPNPKPFIGSFIAPTAVSVAPSAVASAPGSTIPTLAAAPTNVFGTFGGSTSSAKTTTTSATPTLTSTAALPTTNTQIFGSSVSVESKPTASATMIFGSAGSKSAAIVSTTPAPFVFGSSSSIASTAGTATNTVLSGNIVAPATSWPKSGFAFGTSPASAGASNTNEAPKTVFGSFTTAAAPTVAASVASPAMNAGGSVFGSLAASSKTSGPSATFGSVAVNAAAVNPATLFGASASTSTTAAQTTQNLFGSVSAATSSFGAPPSFGSSTTNNTPTFGTVSSATFGSFGTAASSTSSDGASAPKKAEPAFNFGGNTSQIKSTGGFNFGMQANTTAKSAFNFTAPSGPTFNFTGSNSDTNSFSAQRAGRHAGSTKDPSTDKTSHTTVEQFTTADASKGVDQQQKQLTGQLRWSRQRNIQDSNNSNSIISANAQNDECNAAKPIYTDCSGNSSITNSRSNNNKASRKSLINSVEMVGGDRAKCGITRAIKPQMTLNKYKYIRMPHSNSTQNSCNIVSVTGTSSTITGKSDNLCKNRSLSDQIFGTRSVKRSIRVQSKFNLSKVECGEPQTLFVKTQSLLTPNQYRKVNFKSVESAASSIASATPTEKSGSTLQLVSLSPSEVTNQYRLMRCKLDNSKLNTLYSKSVESLPKESERTKIDRKACNSFVITNTNRAPIATDAIEKFPSSAAARAVLHE